MTLLSTALVILALFGSVVAAAARQYSVTDLGTLGGNTAMASAVNSSGQVAGSSSVVSGNIHPFVWSDGIMVDLGVLPSYTDCYAHTINDPGQVIGHCQTAGSIQTQAFIWTAAQGLQPLAAVPNNAGVTGINNNGDVVGWVSPSGSEAFVWWGGTRAQDLGPGVARAINDQNQIVGEDGAGFAVLWDSAGAHSLGARPGDNESFAFSISAAGLPVGSSSNFGQTGAVVFSLYGVANLGTLGGPAGQANSITGSLIVGTASDSSNTSRAFLYDLNGPGVMVDLNSAIPSSAGWMLAAATGLNSSGAIVGSGSINGAQHAFLLTPVPAGGNLLLKSGFEEYAPPALGAPGWVSDDVRQVPAKSETNQPHTGQKNGACWTTDNFDCGMYQEVQAPASGMYTLTVFANADRPNALVGANVNGSLVASSTVEVRGFGNYGTAYVLTFEATERDVIRVWMYSPATPGYLVMDDVTLTPPLQ